MLLYKFTIVLSTCLDMATNHNTKRHKKSSLIGNGSIH